ncbi:MAG: hypothetical protein ACK52V_04745 [Betaproteobacteria bacterium]
MQALHAEAAVTRRATDIRVDWRRIIAELRNRHGSLQAVADRTGIPRRTLGTMAERYCEPRYLDGRALVALWCEISGGDEASPPMIRVSDMWET